MKIANTAPQHLSNHEVLSHFLGLKSDNDHLKQSITTRKGRREQDLRDTYPLPTDAEKFERKDYVDLTDQEEGVEKMAERRGASDELIWVQDQVIQYLCAGFNPTARQTADGIAGLANGLQDHGLVKGEILQICNLAPTQQVELYCIIEDVDQRFQPDPQEKLDAIASEVQSTLLDEVPYDLQPFLSGIKSTDEIHDGADLTEHEYALQQEETEYVHEAAYGADHEEGVGEEVEGDMD